jgi:hypothetical protein
LGRVAAARHLDHLRRSVDGEDPAAVEALAHQRHGDPVPTPDLQELVTGPNAQHLDRPDESLRCH